MSKFVTKWTIIITVALSVAGGSITATAQSRQMPRPQHSEKQQTKAQDNKKLIPYGKVARKVAKRFGGRVVGQGVSEVGGAVVYELRVLKKDGRVIFVTVNARTGKILRTRGE